MVLSDQDVHDPYARIGLEQDCRFDSGWMGKRDGGMVGGGNKADSRRLKARTCMNA